MKTRIVENINRYRGDLRSFEVQYRWFGIWRYLCYVDTLAQAESVAEEAARRGFKGRDLVVAKFGE